MTRFMLLSGLTFMFFFLHASGNINKFINVKYAYLSIGATVMLALLSVFEFVRVYRQAAAADKADAAHGGQEGAEQGRVEGDGRLHAHRELHEHVHDRDHGHDHGHVHSHDRIREQDHGGNNHDHGNNHNRNHDRIREQDHDHDHDHGNNHDHRHGHNHEQDHEQDHDHGHFHGHTHGRTSRLKRIAGYAIIAFPIATGVFLPVQTLDSSFVKAKGFSFPTLEADVQNNPGFHQFLRPDTSVFYGKAGYSQVKAKEMAEFVQRPAIALTDRDYLKGMEVIYNSPDSFMDKTIAFDGFAYKGEQVDGEHYFIFRFGFIHCVADSGVFGMLAEFPGNTQLKDDEWVHIAGKLTWELYQPFKQTIPVLKVTDWNRIDAPKDPYVYRTF